MDLLENEFYLYCAGGVSVAILFIIVSIIVFRRKRVTRKHSKALVESKASNAEWVNDLLASVLGKETLSEATYLRIWLAALNESASKNATPGNIPVSYSHIEFSGCIPALNGITVNESSADSLKFCAQVQIKRILLAGHLKSELSANEAQFSAIISDVDGDVSIAWVSGEDGVKLDAAFMSPPDMHISVKFATSSYSPCSVNDVSVTVQQNMADTVISVPLFQTSAPTADSKNVPMMRDRRSVRQSRRSQISSRMFDISRFRCLAVRVIKAVSLCSEGESVLAYCVVDVDKPARKYSTSAVVDSKDPIWDEQFIFEINDETSEVRVEVFDKALPVEGNIVGRAVLDLEDVVASAATEYTLPLMGPGGVQLERNPLLTLAVELQENMPVTSQPASVTRAVRAPTVILEEDNEQLADLEAGDAGSGRDRNAAAADLSAERPADASLLSADQSMGTMDSRNNTLQSTTSEKKKKGLKHAIKKRFSFNKHKSVTEMFPPQSQNDANYRHSAEDVSKGANGASKNPSISSNQSKRSLASSLQHIFRRKHKTKTLANGASVEATILENDEAAAEEAAEKGRRDLIMAGGDDLRAATLPRVKKNK